MFTSKEIKSMEIIKNGYVQPVNYIHKNIHKKIKVTKNGNTFSHFKRKVKELAIGAIGAITWIENFHPPNGCMGYILNVEMTNTDYGNYYLIRFPLENLIPFEPKYFKNASYDYDYDYEYRRRIVTDDIIDYFNHAAYIEFKKTKKKFIDVLMSDKGFEIIENPFFFEMEEFMI